jgi:hypothetical protein
VSGAMGSILRARTTVMGPGSGSASEAFSLTRPSCWPVDYRARPNGAEAVAAGPFPTASWTADRKACGRASRAGLDPKSG